MCGIAGIYDREGAGDVAAVGRMLDVLAHRGPDGSGTWGDGGLVLGHRRLAIIDLTPDGAQPMTYADGRYVITYNGEVYDYVELRVQLERLGHRFRSSSDTEVLLAAYAEWGASCLSRLNGMFAFAIWDRVERTLFCARDRLGVKPFVYTWNGTRFAFASEPKALHAAGTTPGGYDADAVYEYLARGYTSEGRSFHAGVRELEPGSAMIVSTDRPLRQWRWWSPERSVDAAWSSRAAWSERVAEVLDDAVRLRLRSDVPVGAHLSGGLDSSAVVAAAARHGNPQAFTGAFTDEPASDERRWARSVASMHGVPMHEVEISVDDLPRHFARLMWHMDEPIAGPGAFPQLLVCDLARAHGVPVVLGGQGGDELFGGYLRHRAVHWRRLVSHGRPHQRAVAAAELARLAAHEWRRVRRTSTRMGDERLDPGFLEQVDPGLREQMRRGAFEHASARELMWHDLRAYLPALLHVEDRTSMAASIESRTPLLDWRLVELTLRIPEPMLFRPRDPKPILREAVRGWLPPDVASRRDKKGFPTPLHRWREHAGLATMVRRLAKPAAGARFTVFDPAYTSAPEGLAASELWTMMTVNQWLGDLESGTWSVPRVRPAAA